MELLINISVMIMFIWLILGVELKQVLWIFSIQSVVDEFNIELKFVNIVVVIMVVNVLDSQGGRMVVMIWLQVVLFILLNSLKVMILGMMMIVGMISRWMFVVVMMFFWVFFRLLVVMVCWVMVWLVFQQKIWMKIMFVSRVCYGIGELLLLIRVRCLVGMLDRLKLIVLRVSIMIRIVMLSMLILEMVLDMVMVCRLLKMVQVELISVSGMVKVRIGQFMLNMDFRNSEFVQSMIGRKMMILLVRNRKVIRVWMFLLLQCCFRSLVVVW